MNSRIGHHIESVRGSALLVVLGVVLSASTPAVAAEGGDVGQRVDHLSKTIAVLQRSDHSPHTATEIESIRTLIGQAQAFIASEKRSKAVPLLDRADATAKLVEVKQARVAVEQAAADAEKKAAAAEKKASAMKQAADAAGQQMRKLEGKGL